jgi:hypothetical protein
MVVNLWKVKANGLTNQGYMLCGNVEKSTMHQLWECRYAQQAWDYTKTIVCKLVNGAKPFYLSSLMQWKHVIFISKIPRCLHCVGNVWSLFRGIILWSIWIECNNLVFNNVRWDGCRM